MASQLNNLSQNLEQLSIIDPSLSPPPPPPSPVNAENTPPHISNHSQQTSLLSSLTIEDMFTEGPHTIHPNHMRIQEIFFQPSMVQGRTILSWASFANIILTLEDVNCPSCAQTTILKLTQHLPFFEDNNERLEDIAQRVGGVTILRKWYTLLFWSSTISGNTFFIPGTMDIPNPPSIFDNCRFWDHNQDVNEEDNNSIIGEAEIEGEIVYIREEDISRARE
jgi:hypothetical protein